MKKSLHILLIVLGLGITLYGATVYAERDTAVEIGEVRISKDLEVSKNEKHRLNWVSISGGVLLLLGLGMTMAQKSGK
ncbi:MAG: hypothetical protein D6730_11185 [Bacteroidetes bacterium]|nr:MAG: hypothetical protein D6730_11185 [Bacteroidota bacterium]